MPLPCKVIMRNGVLLPGMVMPVLGPPPPERHPNKRVQQMREEWSLQIIALDGVWPSRYSSRAFRVPVMYPPVK